MTLFVLGYLEASIYALLDFYGKPATFAGVLIAAQGVGAVAGGLTTSPWVRRLGEPGTAAVALSLLAGSVAAIALTSTLAVVFVALVFCGYSLPLLFVAFTTLLQRRTPPRLMGGASAAVETLMGAPQAISLAVGSALVVVLDFHTIFGIIALVTSLGVVYLAVTLRSALWRPVASVTGAGMGVVQAVRGLVDPVLDSAAGSVSPTLER